MRAVPICIENVQDIHFNKFQNKTISKIPRTPPELRIIKSPHTKKQASRSCIKAIAPSSGHKTHRMVVVVASGGSGIEMAAGATYVIFSKLTSQA